MEPVRESAHLDWEGKHMVPSLHPKELKHLSTIAILVQLVDELRQPYNNSKRHDLYQKATDTLNYLEERNLLP